MVVCELITTVCVRVSALFGCGIVYVGGVGWGVYGMVWDRIGSGEVSGVSGVCVPFHERQFLR